jgi:hypothetical protein
LSKKKRIKSAPFSFMKRTKLDKSIIKSGIDEIGDRDVQSNS